MVWALAAITFLSFVVWLHHFFTMGAGANVNAFFGIMTMLIAVPTGVKVFNWLFTMHRGRIHLATPMLWFLGFIFIFVTGGMTGVLMSVPAADFQVHNSLFLIAHFHSMVIGGVLFAFFAGYTYWFPKVFGFKLNEQIGKYAFWFWFIGFLLAFMPLYYLGLMGATRRLDHYSHFSWQPLYIVAAGGVFLIIIGIIIQNVQLIWSVIHRHEYKDHTGDPWNGRTLEWSVPSPAPLYNFAFTPHVHSRDAFWEEKKSKEAGHERPHKHEGIVIPTNSPFGFFIGVCSLVFGFAVIWHIWWMAVLSLLAIILLAILRLSEDETEYELTPEEVEQLENSTAFLTWSPLRY